MNLFLKGDKVQLRFKLAEIFSVAVRMTPKTFGNRFRRAERLHGSMQNYEFWLNNPGNIR